MNANINIEVTATVRWNALENTILSYLYHGEQSNAEFSGDCEYTLEEMQSLNHHIACAMNPGNGEWAVPERFHEEDHTGKVPIEELFDRTETLIANLDRANLMAGTFQYNPDAEV